LYVGSDSQPPCQEGVLRFVFHNTVKVRPSQLDAVNAHLFNREENPHGNARSAQPRNTRAVFFHKDGDTSCADTYHHPYKPALEDISINQVIALEGGHIKHQKKTLVNYLHVPADTVTGQIGSHLTVEDVNPANFQYETLSSLLNGNVLKDSDVDRRRKVHKRK